MISSTIDASRPAFDQPALIDAVRALMRRSLRYYIKGSFPGEYEVAPHHLLLIKKLQGIVPGARKRVMVFMPPGRGKSEISSVRFPAWFHGRHPDSPVIAASHTASLANDFSRQVRAQIDHPNWPFPNVRLEPGENTVEQWKLAGHRGKHFAAGVGKAIAGKRAELLIIDDVVATREQAHSAAYRERAYNWFWNDAHSRLLPGGSVVIIMTRFHRDDLAGRLLFDAENGGDQWEVIELPERAMKDDALGRAEGEYLWPSWYPPSETDVIRKTQPHVWWPLYQQRPGDIAGGLFKRKWFSERYDPTVLPHFGMVFITVDSAFGEETSSDPSVLCMWGVTKTHLYLLDVWRDRVAYPELLAAIRDFHTKWRTKLDRGVWVYIENKASGQSAIQSLQRGSRIPVQPFEPGSASKISRAQDTTPYCAAGRVLLPASAPWTSDWIEEHADFPGGKNDDRVDNTSMATKIFASAGGRPPGSEDFQGEDDDSDDQADDR